MASNRAVRYINTGTGTGTIPLTGLSFQPKVALFFACGRQGTADGISANSESARQCIGLAWNDGGATPYPQMATGVWSEFNANRADTARRHLFESGSDGTQPGCVTQVIGNGTTDGRLELTAWNSDGITLTIQEAFSFNIRIMVLLLAGDVVSNVAIGLAQAPTTAGNQNITVGFQAGLFGVIGIGFPTVPPATSRHLSTTFGLASGTGTNDQWVLSGGGVDNADPMDNSAYCRAGEIIGHTASNMTSMDGRASVSAIGATTVTLNWAEVDGNQRYYMWFAFAGGQYKVGNVLTRTAVEDFPAQTIGFQGIAGLFASAGRAQSAADTPTPHWVASLGMAESPTQQSAHALHDQDNAPTSRVHVAKDEDEIYLHIQDSPTVIIDGSAELKEFAATTMTLTQTDADPSQSFLGYAVFGDTAAAALALNAKGAASSAGKATLSVKRGLGAKGTALSAGAALLAASLGLSAVGAGSSAGSAALGLRRPVSAVGAGASAGTANLARTRNLGAAGAALGAGIARLDATRGLVAAGAGSSAGSAALGAIRPISAAGAATSSGTARLSVTRGIAATGAAGSVGRSQLQIAGAVQAISATGAGNSAGSALLSVTRGVLATGAASSSGFARLDATRGLLAFGAGSSAGSSALSVQRALAATGGASSAGRALLTTEGAVAIAATGAGSSAGSAALSVVRAFEARGAGLSAGSAELSRLRAFAATGAGVSAGRAEFVIAGEALALNATGSALSAGRARLDATIGLLALGSGSSSGSAELSVRRGLLARGSGLSSGAALLGGTRALAATGAAVSSGRAVFLTAPPAAWAGLAQFAITGPRFLAVAITGPAFVQTAKTGPILDAVALEEYGDDTAS